jgi:hypothetical protein
LLLLIGSLIFFCYLPSQSLFTGIGFTVSLVTTSLHSQNPQKPFRNETQISAYSKSNRKGLGMNSFSPETGPFFSPALCIKQMCRIANRNFALRKYFK